MAPHLTNSGHERRSDPGIRLCVPAGFFERLAAAVDFRLITKPAFSRYNPRPSTSMVDPAVYFKILLVEYIFDASSDALRNELTSHPGLRAFLNVDDKNPLPLPNEIVLFRVKLGWMGFKQLFDAVLREAKQNKLSEVDCSILEKRYNNPLVVAVGDPPAASASSGRPAAPTALEAELRQEISFSEDSESGLPHRAAASFSPAESHFQTERSLDPRTGVAGRTQPTYVQSTLQETAQIIWANRPDIREVNRRRTSANFENSWPSSVPSPAAPALHQTQSTTSQAENESGGYCESNRPTSQATGHAAMPRQTRGFESFRVRASASASDSSFRSAQSQPSGSSTLHTSARNTQNQLESEIDPLGIESFFNVNDVSPASNETKVEAPRPASARVEPSVSVSLNQNFTIVSSPVSEHDHHSKPSQRQEHTRIEEPGIWQSHKRNVAVHPAQQYVPSPAIERHQAVDDSYWIEKDSAPSPSERQPSGVVADGLGSVSEQPLIDERQSYSSNRAVTSQERFADERSHYEYLEPAEDRPPHESSDYLQEASPLEETPAFAGYAHALAKRQFWVVEFFTKSLYIAIPLLVVFGVYVLIVVLKNNQSGPFTSQPAVTRAATKEGPRNSVDVPAPLPPVPAANVPEKQMASSKSSEKAATEGTSPSLVKRPVKTAQATAVEPKAPAPSRAMEQSLEALKKEAIVLHLRQTFHLDLQADQYTYQELKEINDRLEKEIKRP